MKKLITLSLVVCLYSSCNGTSVNKNSFPIYSLLKNVNYHMDSIIIIKQLKESLHKHNEFFKSKEYSDLTQISIDSIIYSPDSKKMAIFIITKNRMNERLYPDKTFNWYYSATCYFGIRKIDSLEIFWGGPSFTNSISKNELSKAMRTELLTVYAKLRDVNGNYRYKSNIGDLNFWNCPIWKELEEKKFRKIQFEFEKKKHPENIHKFRN